MKTGDDNEAQLTTCTGYKNVLTVTRNKNYRRDTLTTKWLRD